MKIKAVIFDLDGTLIDTIPYHAESFKRIFELFGKKLSDKKISSVLRLNTEKIYEKLEAKKLLKLDLEKFIELRRRIYYSIIRGKKTVFRDVNPAIKKLRKYKLGIATNSSRTTLLASTEEKFLKKFDKTITYTDVYRAKPDPEMLLAIAKKLRVKPEECIVIGDSIMDAKAAKKAGMTAVSIFRKTGASKFRELKKEKPDFLIKHQNEIPKIIRKIEKK